MSSFILRKRQRLPPKLQAAQGLVSTAGKTPRENLWVMTAFSLHFLHSPSKSTATHRFLAASLALKAYPIIKESANEHSQYLQRWFCTAPYLQFPRLELVSLYFRLLEFHADALSLRFAVSCNAALLKLPSWFTLFSLSI